jgi:hypothetical protein
MATTIINLVVREVARNYHDQKHTNSNLKLIE